MATFEEWRGRILSALRQEASPRKAFEQCCKRVAERASQPDLVLSRNAVLRYLYEHTMPFSSTRSESLPQLRRKRGWKGRKAKVDLFVRAANTIHSLRCNGVTHRADAVRLVYHAFDAHGCYNPAELDSKINDENVRKRLPDYDTRTQDDLRARVETGWPPYDFITIEVPPPPRRRVRFDE